ncbi:hypothetical protein [Cellulosimicrobium arenosum]|uniref:Uncharacterized protein n=1 Tax=Cellulosimicrobium arenosum TaxID=2708133 RepID=A0A927IZL3_9MICO|nr:hypothetical protein [Cellulosimicrobium arenosum]MBD8078714.1 hypothetical protein [Cellulosimicrobium arenosum]
MSPSPTPAPRAARPSPSRRFLVVSLAVVVAVVGLGAGIALAGGLERDTSGAGTHRSVAAGETVATGAFDLTVTSWATTDTIGPDPEADVDALAEAGADAWLVVVLDVLDTDTTTRTLNAAAVTLPADLPGGLELAADVTSSRAETTLLVRDGHGFPAFQPGLTEQVLLAWPVRGDAGGATELDVSLPLYVYRDMYIGGGRRWAETGEDVAVRVPSGEVPTVQDPSVPLDDLWAVEPDDEGAGT